MIVRFLDPEGHAVAFGGVHVPLDVAGDPSSAVAGRAARDLKAWLAEGNMVAPYEPPSLEAVKADALSTVDTTAEKARERFITPGSAQAMVYQEKAEEALALQDDAAPEGGNYPHLAAEVGVTAPDLAGVAAAVLERRRQWLQASAAIEGQRLAAKKAIAEAADAAGVQAVLDGLTWPTPEGA